MAYAKIKTNMSDERFKKIISGPVATPNTPSIMSAPRDKKKSQQKMIILLIAAISLVLNIALAITSLSKNERLNQLESEIEDNRRLINELKEKAAENLKSF